jgi:hypothetical protein
MGPSKRHKNFAKNIFKYIPWAGGVVQVVEHLPHKPRVQTPELL